MDEAFRVLERRGAAVLATIERPETKKPTNKVRGLFREFLVGRAGFELSTNGLKVR